MSATESLIHHAQQLAAEARQDRGDGALLAAASAASAPRGPECSTALPHLSGRPPTAPAW